MTEPPGSEKSADAYRTITEVADALKLPQHVLRFWETKFPQVKPLKRAGGRRFYRPDDVVLLRAIKTLLYGQGYTIKGVQRLMQERGPRGLAASLSSPAGGDPGPAGTRRGEGVGTGHDGGDPVAAGPSRAAPVAGAAPANQPPTARQGWVATGAPLAGDVAARLEAIASDLSECRRLIAMARSIRD